jgi:thiamine-phosphate pyrophosphorylase
MFSRLHSILDVEAAAAAGWDRLDLAKALLDGGAPLIQIRAKRLPSAPFLTLCDALVRVAQPYRAIVIVNDRVDLALMSGAAGVHVGQDDLAPAAARRLLVPQPISGIDTPTAQRRPPRWSRPPTSPSAPCSDAQRDTGTNVG